LTHRQHFASGNIDVLQEIEGDELVVGRSFGIFKDSTQLREMTWPQQVRAVDEGLVRKQRQRRGLDLDDAPSVKPPGRDMVGSQPPVGRLVRAKREQFMIVSI